MYRQVGFVVWDNIPDETVLPHVRDVLEEGRIYLENEQEEKRERMIFFTIKIWS